MARLVVKLCKDHRGAFLARPAPCPPTNLTGWAWAEILKPAKFFLDRA
jgi:hypothetical protein